MSEHIHVLVIIVIRGNLREKLDSSSPDATSISSASSLSSILAKMRLGIAAWESATFAKMRLGIAAWESATCESLRALTALMPEGGEESSMTPPGPKARLKAKLAGRQRAWLLELLLLDFVGYRRLRTVCTWRLPVAHIRESCVCVCKFFSLCRDSGACWWGGVLGMLLCCSTVFMTSNCFM